MIGNLPEWVTAGTAVVAVSGGLLGVYTTTQSRMDVADERLANVIEIVETMVEEQRKYEEGRSEMEKALAKDQVSLAYLKEGQDRIHTEVRRLNEVLTAR